MVKKENEVEDTPTKKEEESQAKKDLKAVYAAYEKQNPERYIAKNKDAELEREIAKL